MLEIEKPRIECNEEQNGAYAKLWQIQTGQEK